MGAPKSAGREGNRNAPLSCWKANRTGKDRPIVLTGRAVRTEPCRVRAAPPRVRRSTRWPIWACAKGDTPIQSLNQQRPNDPTFLACPSAHKTHARMPRTIRTAACQLDQAVPCGSIRGSMFLLAHLSDPHLSPLPAPRWSELAGKRAIGFLNWRRRRHFIHRSDVLARIVADLKANAPDHVAVTGDLVNISLASEYVPAAAWLAALGTARNVTLVPGNHDAYVRAAARHPQAHWGDYMRGDDAGAAAFPFLRRRPPLALIGLSSAVPTAPLIATGRLGVEQIAKLAEMLTLSRREGLFRVVLIHHPPLSRPSRRFRRLLDGPELRSVLARQGAELVIHGHDHEHALIRLDGPGRSIPAVGVPSASEAPPGEHGPAGYNLYRIDGGAGAWGCEVVSRGLARDGATVTEIKRFDL